MTTDVSISGKKEKHDEAIIYFFLGDCRELRRHMAGGLVCSAAKGGCHYITPHAIQGRSYRAFQNGPRR